MGEEWSWHRYYDTFDTYVEVEILYDIYWSPEIKSWISVKKAERNRKIINAPKEKENG